MEPGKDKIPRATFRAFRAFRAFPAFPAIIGCAMACLTGCFTEVGNPGKTQVSATFSIDYANDPSALPKRAQGSAGASDSIRILHFRFNVVEVNYATAAGEAGRIWKVPDSLGQNIDFTGQDTTAVLLPVQVPP